MSHPTPTGIGISTKSEVSTAWMDDVFQFVATFKEFPPRSFPPSFVPATIMEETIEGIKRRQAAEGRIGRRPHSRPAEPDDGSAVSGTQHPVERRRRIAHDRETLANVRSIHASPAGVPDACRSSLLPAHPQGARAGRQPRLACRHPCAGASRSAPLLERRRGEEVDHRFHPARHDRGQRGFRTARPSASPPSTMTARCGPSSRCTSRSCLLSIGSRRWPPQHPDWKTKQPFKAALEDDTQGAGGAGRARISADFGGHPYRHDHRGIRQDRRGLARHCAPSALQPTLHRSGLSADAGAARVSARQRLQDLHRLRRRHRVHAPVDGEGLRHSARAGGGLVRP